MLRLRDMLAEIRGGTTAAAVAASAPDRPAVSDRGGGRHVGVAAMRGPRVLGAGSWGTAFAKILADAGRDVTLWARRQSVADAIRSDRRNPEYLPDVRLPDAGHRHRRRRRGDRRAPSWWCWPCRRRPCAATCADWAGATWPRRHAGLA